MGKWIKLDNPTTNATKAATRMWVSDDGRVFMHADLVGQHANALFLCASFDGVEIVLDGQETYFPAGWLADETPEYCEELLSIAGRVMAVAKGD